MANRNYRKPHLVTCAALAGLCCASTTVSAPDDSFSKPHAISKNYPVGAEFERIRLLGAVTLDQDSLHGIVARNLSAVSWDADESILYALSDDGYVVHLRPRFSSGVLTAVDPLQTVPLRDESGKPLREPFTDSEGMDLLNGRNGISGDSKLLIAFEQPARVASFSTAGVSQQSLALPNDLPVPFRDPKRDIEAITSHPDVGILVGPERLVLDREDKWYLFFSLQGRTYRYQPLDSNSSALVSLEVTADGDVLILERVFQSIFKPIIFALRRIDRDDIVTGGDLRVSEIVHFRSRDHWLIDNFEGVARHEDNRYFMISDDGHNRLQKTILMYFEILAD